MQQPAMQDCPEPLRDYIRRHVTPYEPRHGCPYAPLPLPNQAGTEPLNKCISLYMRRLKPETKEAPSIMPDIVTMLIL